MTGRHKFSELEARMPKERRARIDRLAEKRGHDLDLDKLRIARLLSQAALSEIMHVEQIAKLEKRAGRQSRRSGDR